MATTACPADSCSESFANEIDNTIIHNINCHDSFDEIADDSSNLYIHTLIKIFAVADVKSSVLFVLNDLIT